MAGGRRYGRSSARRNVDSVVMSGPFFERDARKTLRQNVRGLMQRMAEVGEAEAKSRAAGAPRKAAGPSQSASLIRGRVTALDGKPWAVSMVISADMSRLSTRDAERAQAALAGRGNPLQVSARFGTRNVGRTRGHEGTARVFSGTARVIRRAVKEIDLAKGLS